MDVADYLPFLQRLSAIIVLSGYCSLAFIHMDSIKSIGFRNGLILFRVPRLQNKRVKLMNYLFFL